MQCFNPCSEAGVQNYTKVSTLKLNQCKPKNGWLLLVYCACLIDVSYIIHNDWSTHLLQILYIFIVHQIEILNSISYFFIIKSGNLSMDQVAHSSTEFLQVCLLMAKTAMLVVEQ